MWNISFRKNHKQTYFHAPVSCQRLKNHSRFLCLTIFYTSALKTVTQNDTFSRAIGCNKCQRFDGWSGNGQLFSESSSNRNFALRFCFRFPASINARPRSNLLMNRNGAHGDAKINVKSGKMLHNYDAYDWWHGIINNYSFIQVLCYFSHTFKFCESFLSVFL